MSIIQFESDVGKSQMKTIAKRLVQSLGYEVHKIRPSSTWRPPDREPREGKVFFPKPERILKTTYPNLTLLESLKASDFTQSNIPEHEFLQFRRLQSLIYSLRVAGYDVEAMQTEAFIGAVLYTNVNCEVAVTGCEYDFQVNDDVVSKISGRLPNFVWLTTNANIDHDRVKALPIGITDYCGYSRYHSIIGDTEKLKNLIDRQERTQKNLVLMNFNDNTNFEVRSRIRSLFKDRNFVTADTYTADSTGYARYIQGLRSHPFCLAPAGNGIDTHRIWECLYAGCIPIVQKVTALRDFNDLPIFFVDRWQEACDATMLNKIRDEYYQKEWDLRKLTLSYWYQYVCRLLMA